MLNLKGKFSRILPLIGFVCLAILIVVQFWYESAGREILFSEQVVKLRSDVKRGDIIKDDMWFYVKVDKDSVIHGSIVDPNEIVGKSAKQFIPYNSQLSDSFFELPELITDANHFTMKIPGDWLYSVPNTLRARDRIVLKEVSRDVIEADQVEISSGPNSNQKGINSNDSANEATETDDLEIPVYDTEEINKLEGKAGDVVLETTVAYVKDSSNREVVTLSEIERHDGSSVIRDVEIVVTIEEEKILEEFRKKGSKFIILYTEG